MSITGEVSGVTLSYVAREVEGDIMTVKTKFDDKLGENVQKETKVVDPVIVFFPNNTSQVMARKTAEERGFLAQPEILNFAQVQDQKTAAGRYKNAIKNEDRIQAWLDMENKIITDCVAASGHPLALDCNYSDKSVYLDAPTEEIAA